MPDQQQPVIDQQTLALMVDIIGGLAGDYAMRIAQTASPQQPAAVPQMGKGMRYRKKEEGKAPKSPEPAKAPTPAPAATPPSQSSKKPPLTREQHQELTRRTSQGPSTPQGQTINPGTASPNDYFQAGAVEQTSQPVQRAPKRNPNLPPGIQPPEGIPTIQTTQAEELPPGTQPLTEQDIAREQIPIAEEAGYGVDESDVIPPTGGEIEKLPGRLAQSRQPKPPKKPVLKKRRGLWDKYVPEVEPEAAQEYAEELPEVLSGEEGFTEFPYAEEREEAEGVPELVPNKDVIGGYPEDEEDVLEEAPPEDERELEEEEREQALLDEEYPGLDEDDFLEEEPLDEAEQEGIEWKEIHGNIADMMETSIKESGIDKQQAKRYRKAMNSSLSEMSIESMRRLKEGTKNVHISGNKAWITDTYMEVVANGIKRDVALGRNTDKIKRELGELKKAAAGGTLIPAFYNVSAGELYLDGGSSRGEKEVNDPRLGHNPRFWESKDQVLLSQHYLHELAHAIDGPNRELSRSSEWKEAWKREIGDNPKDNNFALTRYATTRPSDGLAEIFRCLHNPRVKTNVLVEKFPSIMKLTKGWGLWPKFRLKEVA